MGTVWSARNELIDREVAIKMMRPEAAANPVSLQRFFTEAKASGRLRHPNITEIFDLGQAEDGSPFLVLELLTGEPLDGILRRVPMLAPVQVLLLAKSIASGLLVAHNKGIIHRDLKPANIYLHRDPVTLEIIPKILDFGISKVTGPEAIDHHATHTGTVVGSPTYMCPEQARGVSDIDARADIWSVGVLMYKCLTGRAPFNAANYNALMVAIMTEPHQPVTRWVPTIPKIVSDIVDDCLKKERQDRIQSAKAMLQRIDSALLSLNAERAKLELPSDDIDDDMPTIARGDRNELIQLVTATAAAPPALGHGHNGAGAVAGSVTPPPTSDPSGTQAPQVLSSPQLAAVSNPQLAATSPATREIDPILAAKRRDQRRLIGIIAGATALLFTFVFLIVKLSRSSNADEATDKASATKEKPDDEKPSKTKDKDKEKDKEKSKVEPNDTGKPHGTAAATTATAKPPPPPATTTSPPATTAAPPPPPPATTTAPPPATTTAAPTATTPPKPTSTSTGTSTSKPPPKGTGPGTKVIGPGF